MLLLALAAPADVVKRDGRTEQEQEQQGGRAEQEQRREQR
jgi:hypothetical protein